jgi:shikimate kinase
MKIFLLGLTGAGKSTVGKLLANKLSYPFMDLDEVIRYETHRSIEDIFEKDGEEYFRKLENKFLKKVASIDRRVIATGGGAPCYLDSMDFIKNNGLSIFLYTPLDLVTERLYDTDTTHRPILKGKNKEELHDFLSQKLMERLPYYSRADFSMDTNVADNPEKVASMLFVLVRLMEQEKMSLQQYRKSQQ